MIVLFGLQLAFAIQHFEALETGGDPQGQGGRGPVHRQRHDGHRGRPGDRGGVRERPRRRSRRTRFAAGSTSRASSARSSSTSWSSGPARQDLRAEPGILSWSGTPRTSGFPRLPRPWPAWPSPSPTRTSTRTCTGSPWTSATCCPDTTFRRSWRRRLHRQVNQRRNRQTRRPTTHNPSGGLIDLPHLSVAHRRYRPADGSLDAAQLIMAVEPESRLDRHGPVPAVPCQANGNRRRN